MGAPIFVRSPAADERQALAASLRSSAAFTLRRSQIVLASAGGLRSGQIAEQVGLSREMVRQVIHRFNANGLSILKAKSRRPHHSQAAFAPCGREQLRALLHRSPRDFGQSVSLWTLNLAAQVCFEQGLTKRRISGETIRATLKQMHISWQRAKHWITSPDEAYARKKTRATA